MMLASDLNNPAFVGAVNPDSLLHVEFYMHEPEDPNVPWVNGKPVRLSARPYVRILKPGDNTSVIETPVREDHKQRWPEKWMYFQIQQGTTSGPEIPGWKIEDWSFLSPEQVHQLKFLRFYTVEQIAGASDAQVQSLGIGGLGMRVEAQKALKEKSSAGITAELASKDREIAEMKARMERLEALLTPKAEAPKEVKYDKPILDVNVSNSERDALAAQYLAKFGKKPHHKAGIAKIKADLEAGT